MVKSAKSSEKYVVPACQPPYTVVRKLPSVSLGTIDASGDNNGLYRYSHSKEHLNQPANFEKFKNKTFIVYLKYKMFLVFNLKCHKILHH